MVSSLLRNPQKGKLNIKLYLERNREQTIPAVKYMYTCILVMGLNLGYFPSLSPPTFRKNTAELGKFLRTMVIRGMEYFPYEEQINRLGLLSLEKEDE